jgi:hypothetical protein
MNQVLSRTLVFSAVAVLSACGGGGGGVSSGSTSSGSTSVVVSGTAAKGLLQNALVTAYCGVKSSSNAIGTATTDTNGNYSLTLTQTCAQPVEVVVTAKADGSTIMVDEIDGPKPAPISLNMRAFVSAASATVSLPVTPFTDMAAAIVESSVGTANALSSSMVSNANTAIITNVLGGNAGLFTAQPLPPSAYNTGSTTADQQQLIVLLSGISQAAQTASGSTTGERVQAVLTQLADQAKATIAVTSTGFTVAANADPSASGNTPLATISSGLTALATSTTTSQGLTGVENTIKSSVTNVQTAVVQTSTTQITQTAGGTVLTPSSAVQDAIAAARTLFAAIRTNVLALVNPQQSGFLQNKATALTDDVNGLAMAGTYHFTDILLAANRATTLLAQTNQAVAAGGANVAPQGATAKSNGFGNFYQHVSTEGSGEMTCNAYYTAGAGVTSSLAPVSRTAPVAGNSGNPVATCSMLIFSGDSQRMMQFVVLSPASKPTSGTNTFNYVNRIRTWANPNCNSAADATCAYTDSNEVQGQLTATLDSSLAVTAMTIATQPVIPFQSTAASTISLNYTASKSSTVNTLAFSGGLTSGALKYGFVSGSQLVLTDTSTSTVTSGTVVANLIGQIQTGAFQYDGTFGLNGSSSGGTASSGTMSFSGKISTMTNSVATAFIEGSLTGDVNAKTVAFSGKVTNGTSVNSLSITGDAHIAGQQGATVTILTPGYSFTATGTNYDNVLTPSTMTVTSSDGTKIEVSRSNGISKVDIKSSVGTKIGSVNGNLVNFDDGSYIILN